MNLPGALAVLWPALLTALVGYGAAVALWRSEGLPRSVLVVAALVLAVPWLLAVGYYTHLLDGPLYYEWRSWPVTDFAVGAVGALMGVVVARRSSGERPVFLGAGLAALLVVLAFAKPVVGLMDPDGLNDRWVEGVCIQTSEASCGACATATVLNALGEDVTEREMAAAAHTSVTGTLNWYLAREVRDRGYRARFAAPANPWEVTPPAILGVRTGGVGHFVVLLSVEEGGVVIGEPLSGREEMSWAEFGRRYRFERFALEISAPGREPPATE